MKTVSGLLGLKTTKYLKICLFCRIMKSFTVISEVQCKSRVPIDLESHGINLVMESQGALLMVRENDVYCLSCMTVVYFC